MPRCFVSQCKVNDRKKAENVKFHRFPFSMKNEWLKALGLNPDVNIPKYSVICSEHFKKEDYEIRGSVTKLKCDAVPSLKIGGCTKKLVFDDAKLISHPLSEERKNEFVTDNQVKQENTISATLQESPLKCLSSSSSDGHVTRKRKILTPITFQTSPTKSISSSSSDGYVTKRRKMATFQASPSKSISSSSSGDYDAGVKNIISNIIPTSSATSKRKNFPSLASYHTSPAKSISSSSSIERRRKYIRTFHSYSHSPNYIHKQLLLQKEKNIHIKNKLKTARQTNKRLKRKVSSLNDVLYDLKKKRALSDTQYEALEQTLSGIPLSLMKRLLITTRQGKKSRTKYPPELRSFAMTLQFYSLKAYEYVRQTFNHALPHQSVIRSWFSKIDCEPGFSAPAFTELKSKVAEEKVKNRSIYYSLMLDEMAIKKQIEFDGKITRGYVDFRAGIDNDEADEATEALVLMVVAVNGRWKLPIAYFLIRKLSGQERAAIVKQALIKLHETGVHIVSLTCDGPNVHLNMMKTLGCKITNMQNIQSWFKHPTTGDKVFVVFDVCHMLKLVRNNWARLRKIKDPEGNTIDWTYIEKLHEIQKQELFSFGNKLTRRHIEWRKQVMKVRLAAHTLSASVADALEFLHKDMNHSDFSGVAATVNFIRKIDQLFDMLNSRNPFAKGFKSPIRKQNESFWKPFFENTVEYLQNCTNMNNVPLRTTTNKTPFIGFITSILSFMGIAEEYLTEGKLNYLLGYKLSQDHLELFFCSMRSRNGWNNNPTALQFIRSYKRLLLHHDIKTMTGNCIPQDTTNILSVSSARSEPSTSDTLKMRLSNIEQLGEEVEELPVNLKLTDMAENVVTYISGYVVKMLTKIIHCEKCKEHLQQDSYSQDDSSFKLLRRKQRGGLKIPSRDVKDVCKHVELRIRNLYSCTNKMPTNKDPYIYRIINMTVQYFLTEKPNVFNRIDEHILDTSIDEDMHRKKVIQQTAFCYCKIRFYNLAKRHTDEMRGENIRTSLNRLILFKHQ